MQVQQTCSFEYAKMNLEMENLSKNLYSILQDLASSLGVLDADFKIERPKDESNGDFASNIALVLAKKLNKNPYDLAVEISKTISLPKEFEKIEAVKPGFINFYLSSEYITKSIATIVEKGSFYGSSDIGKDKKASVEFISANPTGPLHVGNARGGPIGDVIANVLTKVGFSVTREYLHNNVGGQVERLGEAIYFTLHPDQKAEDYEIQYKGEYIKELSEKVSEEISSENDLSQQEFIEKAGKIAVSILFEEIKKDSINMGIKFDKFTNESDLRNEVPEALSKIQKYLKEKDGAEWFAPNDEYLKDRETVVKKSSGEYTYFASDIAYHNKKLSENDLVIDILGANHSGHVPKLFAVSKALGFDENALKVVLYQYVRVKRGSEVVKMSKRAGDFVTAGEVLEEVGKDAFRFFLLSQRSQTHMDFDLELAKKRASDNPVFYVQYAYTRISSIFKKAEGKFEGADLSLLKEKEEIDLIRKLLVFPSLVEDVYKNMEVNSLTSYALDLAGLFHKFYEANQVITKDSKLTSARLALLKATEIVLKNTLDLLGVSAPQEM
jgi:arginyl-tRNA synthetase